MVDIMDILMLETRVTMAEEECSFMLILEDFPNGNGSNNFGGGYSPQMQIHKASSDNKSIYQIYGPFIVESSDNTPICQIFHKFSHIADVC